MNKLLTIYRIIFYRYSTLMLYLFSRISAGKKVFFKGFPSILINKDAKISIGDNTVINSSNYGYHINMYSKCKFYADRAGANIKIGKNCRIHGTCIHAYKSIIIGDNCLIAANTNIIDGNGHLLSIESPENRINTSDDGKEIVIENNVWIASNCTILGGTRIGEGSIITTGSVVKGVIPSKCIFGGNPAKLIKQY